MPTLSSRNAFPSLSAITAQMHRDEGAYTAPVQYEECTYCPVALLKGDARPNLTTDTLFFGLGRELGLPLNLHTSTLTDLMAA